MNISHFIPSTPFNFSSDVMDAERRVNSKSRCPVELPVGYPVNLLCEGHSRASGRTATNRSSSLASTCSSNS